MRINQKQRAAVFENLKKTGKFTNKVPGVPTPHPKMLTPLTPPTLPGAPKMEDPNKVNQNYIGNGRSQRFKKIKSMFGL